MGLRCASRKVETIMADDSIDQNEYVRQVLDAYRRTPGTMGTVRRPDRLVAAQLHQRGVPLMAVENAFVLAAGRRLTRPADSPPLGAIRSLAYFLPVIEEVLSLRVNPDYFRYLRGKIDRAIQTPKPAL
jgi:hypothetical protein